MPKSKKEDRKENRKDNKKENRKDNKKDNKKDNRKEDFKIDLQNCAPELKGCGVYQAEIDDLSNTWSKGTESDNLGFVESEYVPRLGRLSDKILSRADRCYDNDFDLRQDSGGDCPDCDYAKKLFGHLGFDKDHDLGFGPMSNYCPHSLGAPGSQVCLQNLKSNAKDISALSRGKMREMINDIKDDTHLMDTRAKALDAKISEKLQRDYVDGYLQYSQLHNDTKARYRLNQATDEELMTSMANPVVNFEASEEITATHDQLELKKQLEPHFGMYKFEPNHLYSILETAVAKGFINQFPIKMDDVKKQLESQVIFDETGIYIRYADETVDFGIQYNKVEIVDNPKVPGQPAYRLEGVNGQLELYYDGDHMYVKVVDTSNTDVSQFLEGLVYYLVKI